MSELNEVTKDTLFVGATRPTTVAGVTMEVFVINGLLMSVIFIGTGNPLMLLLGVPAHLASVAVCSKEPRWFSLAFLWLTNMSACKPMNKSHWKAKSYSPLTVKKTR